jgi:hypothetical protein
MFETAARIVLRPAEVTIQVRATTFSVQLLFFVTFPLLLSFPSFLFFVIFPFLFPFCFPLSLPPFPSLKSSPFHFSSGFLLQLCFPFFYPLPLLFPLHFNLPVPLSSFFPTTFRHSSFFPFFLLYSSFPFPFSSPSLPVFSFRPSPFHSLPLSFPLLFALLFLVLLFPFPSTSLPHPFLFLTFFPSFHFLPFSVHFSFPFPSLFPFLIISRPFS